MYPILGRIGPFTIHSYGVALAAAFVGAFLWIRHECAKRGISTEIATDLLLAAAVGGIAGARAAYVIAHWGYFAKHLVDIVKLDQGGLVFYGGVAGGAAGAILVVRLRGLRLAQTADMAAPALALGAAIGRIGCLLNGCCYGRPTKGLFGITFPAPIGGPRLPTQVLDGLYNLAIFAVLVLLAQKFRFKAGFLFWLYAALYAVSRFGIEFLRDNSVLIAGLSGAQYISLGLLAVSVVVLALRYRSPAEAEEVTGELGLGRAE